MNEALVVCTTAHLTAFYKSWKKDLTFGKDEYLLCDIAHHGSLPSDITLDFIQDNIVNYTEADVRETLNCPDLEASDKHWWNLGGGRSLIWFYAHYRMLYFYKLQPNYDYYWFFDDDVVFPNVQLQEFLEAHKDLTVDCAITYTFSNLGNSNPSNVPFIGAPMNSFHGEAYNWLIHYPGAGDNQSQDIKEKYGSFFPIVRFSNRALKQLLEEQEKGYYGYSEGFVPTVLNHYGMSLYSIFNPDSKVVKDENILIHHKDAEMLWKNL